jgi:lysophospholipase L1-like esterase
VQWSSFIAVGDSFTEGLSDGPGSDGRYRGWADRVAWSLGLRDPQLRYANLAVRGKLLHEIVDVQLIAALAKQPALLTFHAGGNDILRPSADLASVARRYDRAVERAVADAGTAVIFTVLERSGASGTTADRLAARISGFNDDVRATAARHGATLVDLASITALHDRRFWHADRLHLSPDGHARVAAAVLDALGAPDKPPAGLGPMWWRSPLTELPPRSRAARLSGDLRWAKQHLAPWVGRRLRGVSSGDGMSAKRPRLARP